MFITVRDVEFFGVYSGVLTLINLITSLWKTTKYQNDVHRIKKVKHFHSYENRSKTNHRAYLACFFNVVKLSRKFYLCKLTQKQVCFCTFSSCSLHRKPSNE